MEVRSYPYVGPAAIRERIAGMPPGAAITRVADAVAWLAARGLRDEVVTFTIGLDRVLRLADRRSEHVACAGFAPVLAAGELQVRRTGDGAEIAWVTNQSTGFCPEPACWSAVDDALTEAGLDHPAALSQAYDFRRCPACDGIHLVKEDDLTCACGAALPAVWNL